GLVWPKVLNRPIPPAGKRPWPAFVPAIDADGNDPPGIRLPALAAAEGTYLGWNLRKAGYGEGDLCLLAGSYLPFAKDAASRGEDARLSLAERYPAADRSARAAAAAEALQREGFLLAEDVGKVAGAAK
ncbi:MAG: alpha/beta hydrolase domain-containing protein, partial [Methylotenera sp.]